MAADETPGNYALLQDRGLPLGNSTDTFGRRALHVKVGNDSTEAIPVYVVDAPIGQAIYVDAPAVSLTSGSAVTLINYLASSSVLLNNLFVSCRQPGRYEVKLNGAVIGAGRTGAGCPNSAFAWEGRPLNSGDTLVVEFTQQPGGPSGATADAFLRLGTG